jgi:hypothetical protein
MLRLRPVRPSAAAIRLADSLAAVPGVGAIARTLLDSALAIRRANRPVNVARNVGKNSRSKDRNPLCALAHRKIAS